jgi:hypothetical protein
MAKPIYFTLPGLCLQKSQPAPMPDATSSRVDGSAVTPMAGVDSEETMGGEDGTPVDEDGTPIDGGPLLSTGGMELAENGHELATESGMTSPAWDGMSSISIPSGKADGVPL